MRRVAGRREDEGGGDAQPLCFAKGVGFCLVVLDDDLLGVFSKKRGDLGMVGLKKTGRFLSWRNRPGVLFIRLPIDADRGQATI